VFNESDASDSFSAFQLDSSSPSNSRVVGHYILEMALGVGGQGDVFAAWDTLLLRPVALKRMRQAGGKDSNRHLLEARRSAGLRHAAFVGIHGIVSDNSGSWIVMERVFGRDLSSVMKDGGRRRTSMRWGRFP
jgi:eukaryotic-like serine/threonine-protein kinase